MKFWGMKLAALACAAFLFIAVNEARAEHAYHDYGHGYSGYGELTPEQIEKAKKIINDNYTEMENTRMELGDKRAKLDAQLSSPTPDPNEIERLSRDIGTLRGRMLAVRANVKNALAKEGLPSEYYAPRPPFFRDSEEVWHHGGRRGHGGPRGHGYRGGCYGCW